MSEIVTRIADNVGISPDLAEKALGMMLGFLQREAADGPVATMIEAIPGAAELVAKYNGEGAGGGGLLGGLMSAIGGGGTQPGQPLPAAGSGNGGSGCRVSPSSPSTRREVTSRCSPGQRASRVVTSPAQLSTSCSKLTEPVTTPVFCAARTDLASR